MHAIRLHLTVLALLTLTAPLAMAQDPAVTGALDRLDAAGAAMAGAGSARQGTQLQELVGQMRAAAQAGGIPRSQVQAVRELQGQLERLAQTWGQAGQQERAANLRTHAATIAAALPALEAVAVESAPSVPQAPGAAASAADGLSELTVVIRMEDRAAARAPGAPGAVVPRPVAPRPQYQDDGVPLGPPGGFGGGGVPMGPPGGGYGPSAPQGPAVTGRSQGKVLVITLAQLEQTFSDVYSLSRALPDSMDRIRNATITLQIAPDVAWQDIQAVLNAFANLPLSGDIKLADVTLSRPEPVAAAPSAGAGEVDSWIELTVEPAEMAPVPQVEPVAPTTPEQPAQASESASPRPLRPQAPPPNWIAMVQNHSKVLYVLNVSAENYEWLRPLIVQSLQRLAPGGQFSIIATNGKSEGSTDTVIDWTPAGAAGVAAAQQALAAYRPDDRPDYMSAVNAVVPHRMDGNDRTVIVSEAAKTDASREDMVDGSRSLTSPAVGPLGMMLEESEVGWVWVGRPPGQLGEAMSRPSGFRAVILPD